MIKNMTSSSFLECPASVFITRQGTHTTGKYFEILKQRWPDVATFPQEYAERKKTDKNFCLTYSNEKGEVLHILCVETTHPNDSEGRANTREQVKALLGKMVFPESTNIVLDTRDFLSCENYLDRAWAWFTLFTELPYSLILSRTT